MDDRSRRTAPGPGGPASRAARRGEARGLAARLTAPLAATVMPRRTRAPPPATMRSTARWIAAWARASAGPYPRASVTEMVRSLSPPPGSSANPAIGGSPASAAAARACTSGSSCGSGTGRPSASAASRAPSTANGTGPAMSMTTALASCAPACQTWRAVTGTGLASGRHPVSDGRQVKASTARLPSLPSRVGRAISLAFSRRSPRPGPAAPPGPAAVPSTGVASASTATTGTSSRARAERRQGGVLAALARRERAEGGGHLGIGVAAVAWDHQARP